MHNSTISESVSHLTGFVIDANAQFTLTHFTHCIFDQEVILVTGSLSIDSCTFNLINAQRLFVTRNVTSFLIQNFDINISNSEFFSMIHNETTSQASFFIQSETGVIIDNSLFHKVVISSRFLKASTAIELYSSNFSLIQASETGFFLNSGTLTATDCKFQQWHYTANSLDFFIFYTIEAEILVTSCYFDFIQSDRIFMMSGLYERGGFSLINSTFTENSGDFFIDICVTSNLVIAQNFFYENSVTGGLITIADCSTAVNQALIFENNFSENQVIAGTGSLPVFSNLIEIYDFDELIMHDNLFSDNYLIILIERVGHLEFYKNTIEYYYNPAVQFRSCAFVDFNQNIISRNNVEFHSPGTYLVAFLWSTGVITDCEFTNNTDSSPYTDSALIYSAAGELIVTNSSFSHNTAAMGTAIFTENSQVHLRESYFL